MKKIFQNEWVKRILIGLGIAAVLYAGINALMLMIIAYPTNDRDNHDPAKQQEMIAITVDAAELAPIPKQAKIGKVWTEGNMFTREFHVAFDADPAVIKRWVAASKGLSNAKITKSGTMTQYVVNPQSDFQCGIIDVDLSRRSVKLYVGD